jgi:hypothetical protein
MKESEYVDSLTDVGETVFGLQGLTTIYISSNDEAHFRESLVGCYTAQPRERVNRKKKRPP